MTLIAAVKKRYLKFIDNSFYQTGAILASSNLVSSALRFIGGILTARLLAPEELGLFNGISLVLGYLPFVQLGVLNGLNRELPYYLGVNDEKKAKSLASTANYWALLLSVLSFIIFLIIALYYLIIKKSYFIGIAWLANSFGAFLLFYGQQYLSITFRTNNEFKKLSRINVIINIVSLLLVFLVSEFGYLGLCLRSILANLAYILLLFKYKPISVKPSFSTKNFSHLFFVGAPIFTVGYAYSLWGLLDSTLVMKFLGAENFGFYQLTHILLTTLSLLPQAFSQVLYPKLAFQYGKENNAHNITRAMIKPLIILFITSLPISFVIWHILPFIVKVAMPNYLPGIKAAQIALLVFCINCLTPIQILFNVLKKQGLHLISIAIGVIVYLIALYVLSVDSVDIINFPKAMVIGKSAYIIICILMIYFLQYKGVRKKDENLNG